MFERSLPGYEKGLSEKNRPSFEPKPVGEFEPWHPSNFGQGSNGGGFQFLCKTDAGPIFFSKSNALRSFETVPSGTTRLLCTCDWWQEYYLLTTDPALKLFTPLMFEFMGYTSDCYPKYRDKNFIRYWFFRRLEEWVRRLTLDSANINTLRACREPIVSSCPYGCHTLTVKFRPDEVTTPRLHTCPLAHGIFGFDGFGAFAAGHQVEAPLAQDCPK
jgi:hypothetical protein